MKFSILFFFLAQVSFSQIKVIGYLPSYRWEKMEDLDYSHLSHVCAAFANPDENGNLGFEKDLHQFVTIAHRNGTKAIVSFCGGGDYSWGEKYKVYEELLSTPQKRTSFIHKIMDFSRQYKLDGIDNDMEGKAVELTTYNSFSQELADSLHAGGFEYSCALGTFGQWGANNMNDTTLQKMDFVMTMSYGGVGNWNWKEAPNEGTFEAYRRDIDYFINREYDKRKVLGGIPFYFTEFPKTQQESYWKFNGLNCELYTDPLLAKQDPFHSDTIFSSSGNVTYLNSIETIYKKIDIAIQNQSGIMIWELGQDCFDGSHSLIDNMGSYMDMKEVGIDVSGLEALISRHEKKGFVTFSAPFKISEVIVTKNEKQVYVGKSSNIPVSVLNNMDKIMFKLTSAKSVFIEYFSNDSE